MISVVARVKLIHRIGALPAGEHRVVKSRTEIIESVTRILQSKSITALKSFNDTHFLDFHFHRMNDTLSNENLVGARVLFGFQRFITIPTSRFGLNHRSAIHPYGILCLDKWSWFQMMGWSTSGRRDSNC